MKAADVVEVQGGEPYMYPQVLFPSFTPTRLRHQISRNPDGTPKLPVEYRITLEI